MGSMWLRWVCSDVGVVCSDRCIMGQVVDRHGGPWVMGFGFFGSGLIWAFFWVFSGLINVSWVKLQSMWLWGFSGLIIDVFLAIFWVNHVASTFSGLIGVSWVKLRSMWLQRFFGYFRRLGFLIDGVGFWSVALLMVCVRWLGLYWWFLIGGSIDGFWSVALLIGGMGLMVCVCVWPYWWFGGLCLCVALLMVCVCVCVCVCVVMGLDRLIDVSWVCVWLCVLNQS